MMETNQHDPSEMTPVPGMGVEELAIEDRLVRGAIDLHTHAYPEFSLKIRERVNDIKWAELARAAGLRAIVMKSHVFPTAERAHLIRKVVPGIGVYGGIALNLSVGGLNPLAVDFAAEVGAKMIWMPTWSSKNDLSKSQFFLSRMKKYVKAIEAAVPGPEVGVEIIEGGKLKPVVKDIIDIAKNHGMVISSGHLSVQESLVLVEACQKQGVPFTMAHPFSRSVGASIAEMQEVAKRGGYIEHCFITTMPMHQRLELSKIIEAIEAVGPDRTVLASDAIHAWNPPPPEALRMFVGSLLQLGLDPESIATMIQDNPAKILGLETGA
jgi:hypothetical protein